MNADSTGNANSKRSPDRHLARVVAETNVTLCCRNQTNGSSWGKDAGYRLTPHLDLGGTKTILTRTWTTHPAKSHDQNPTSNTENNGTLRFQKLALPHLDLIRCLYSPLSSLLDSPRHILTTKGDSRAFPRTIHTILETAGNLQRIIREDEY
jgi:hypothetical protein